MRSPSYRCPAGMCGDGGRRTAGELGRYIDPRVAQEERKTLIHLRSGALHRGVAGRRPDGGGGAGHQQWPHSLDRQSSALRRRRPRCNSECGFHVALA